MTDLQQQCEWLDDELDLVHDPMSGNGMLEIIEAMRKCGHKVLIDWYATKPFVSFYEDATVRIDWNESATIQEAVIRAAYSAMRNET